MANAPAVTIAIPAYKPQFLAQAIASVLAQTFPDFELLISDDCPNEAVKAVVAQFGDPRIRLIEGPRQGLVPNSVQLWEHARADLLKYVYDDDFLLPFCVAALRDPMEADPELTYAFSSRYLVDATGAILGAPVGIHGDKPRRLAANAAAPHMISKIRNPIGEPTNILIRRSRFPDARCLSHFCEAPVRHMIDVAFYLNAALRGPSLGLPTFHAAFRRHGDQVTSMQTAPGFGAGLLEWELFIRGAVQLGLARPEDGLAGLPELDRAFRAFETRYPELAEGRERLTDLRARLEAGDRGLVDEPFRAALSRAEAMVLARSSRSAVAPG